MSRAKVISAFPASGKSTYYREWSQYSRENVWRKRNNGEQVLNNIGLPCGDKILDSDSSQFSWVKDENDINTDVRNPDFPNNYIQHIKDHLESEDIIFVSSHDIVRKALEDNRIDYYLVYPEKELLDEWIYRMKNRGNNEKFINFITSNWSKFIDDMDAEIFPTKVRLYSGINMDAITVTLINGIMDYKEEVQ